LFPGDDRLFFALKVLWWFLQAQSAAGESGTGTISEPVQAAGRGRVVN
jgi:hypothetical protein